MLHITRGSYGAIYEVIHITRGYIKLCLGNHDKYTKQLIVYMDFWDDQVFIALRV